MLPVLTGSRACIEDERLPEALLFDLFRFVCAFSINSPTIKNSSVNVSRGCSPLISSPMLSRKPLANKLACEELILNWQKNLDGKGQ